MNIFESKIQAYYDLRPVQFSVLHSLAIYQGMGPDRVFEQRVCIVLDRLNDEKCEQLYLDFDGVRNLRFQQPDWSEISLNHIEIITVADDSNMKNSFRVRDTSQDSIISFDCRQFEANVGGTEMGQHKGTT